METTETRKDLGLKQYRGKDLYMISTGFRAWVELDEEMAGEAESLGRTVIYLVWSTSASRYMSVIK